MPAFAIRRFDTTDIPFLYRICLLTGRDGGDATGTVDDEILGHFFAAPYAVSEPELCFVLTMDGTPVGYILGTSDSIAFRKWTEENWFPTLRTRYEDANDERPRQAAMIRAIGEGYKPPDVAREFPAHLHIDILPEGQGLGYGPKLIDRFIAQLRSMNVVGVHLGVSRSNERAMTFYPKLGFQPLAETGSGRIFGLKLG